MIAIAADKGSPGATTTALVLASVWPEFATVVEADPWGGDLLLRARHRGEVLADRETVLSLATAATTHEGSRGTGGDLVDRYAQDLSSKVRVVPGPISAERASAVPSWGGLAAALSVSSRPVVADLGRLHALSPSMPIAAAAEVMVVVCRAEVDSVLRLRERINALVPVLADLRQASPRVAPIVISPRRHGAAYAHDVQLALAATDAGPFVAAVGWLAWDPSAVQALYRGEDPTSRSLARSALLKSAADVVAVLAEDPGPGKALPREGEGAAEVQTPRWADVVNGARS